MQDLISVIIPIYNVENYIERCLNSVINQTYQNIEIILVNDGSTDNSGKICDDYSRKYNNIKVVHKENGGLSSARNVGLEICNGEYIGFVDSDDWIEPDMYEYLLSIIKMNNSQVAQIAPILTNNENILLNKQNEKIEIYNNKNILEHYLYITTIKGGYSVCTCLFKKDILKNIFFEESKIFEDIVFKYKALSKTSIFVVSNLKKYYYFQRMESISSAGLKQRDFDLYYVSNELYELAKKEKNNKIIYLAEVKKARTPFSLLSKIAYYGINDKKIDENEIVKKLIKENRENFNILIFSPIPITRKILLTLYCINFNFTKKILNTKKTFF